MLRPFPARHRKTFGRWRFTLLLLTLVFIARFRRSKLGTAALMVQMNPALAASLGIDPRKIRLAVFVLSAPITGLAGWLYAYQRAYVGPDMFETYFLVLMLTAVVLVGRRILDRALDRHRDPDRAAEPAVARRRLEQDRAGFGTRAGPDFLARPGWSGFSAISAKVELKAK